MSFAFVAEFELKERKTEGKQIAHKLQGDISFRWQYGHAKEPYF